MIQSINSSLFHYWTRFKRIWGLPRVKIKFSNIRHLLSPCRCLMFTRKSNHSALIFSSIPELPLEIHSDDLDSNMKFLVSSKDERNSFHRYMGILTEMLLYKYRFELSNLLIGRKQTLYFHYLFIQLIKYLQKFLLLRICLMKVCYREQKEMIWYLPWMILKRNSKPNAVVQLEVHNVLLRFTRQLLQCYHVCAIYRRNNTGLCFVNIIFKIRKYFMHIDIQIYLKS